MARPSPRILIGLALALAPVAPGCAWLESKRRPAELPIGRPATAADGPMMTASAAPDSFKAAPGGDAATVVRTTARPGAAGTSPVATIGLPAGAAAAVAAPGRMVAALEPPPATGGPKVVDAAPKATLGSVMADARRAVDALHTYRVPIRRQERLAGGLTDAEDVVLNIRRDPQAVRLEWPNGPHKGREVIYAADGRDRLMHVNNPGSILPVPIQIAPDSPLALRNSRHPITEAGFDAILGDIEAAQARQARGDGSGGVLAYAGVVTPGSVGVPCHKVTRVTPDGDRWTVLFDARTHLPRTVEADAANGDLLERNAFGEVQADLPELADASAFDPSLRWNTGGGGLLSRVARTPAAPASDNAPATR